MIFGTQWSFRLGLLKSRSKQTWQLLGKFFQCYLVYNNERRDAKIQVLAIFFGKCLTWRMHLMRSPGAIIIVVKMPENPPAADNWATLKSWLGWDFNRFLPKSLPKKLRANMGATPTKGAAIPAKTYKFCWCVLLKNFASSFPLFQTSENCSSRLGHDS